MGVSRPICVSISICIHRRICVSNVVCILYTWCKLLCDVFGVELFIGFVVRTARTTSDQEDVTWSVWDGCRYDAVCRSQSTNYVSIEVL